MPHINFISSYVTIISSMVPKKKSHTENVLVQLCSPCCVSMHLLNIVKKCHQKLENENVAKKKT